MSLRYGVIVFGRFTNQRDGSFGLLWTNPDVDVLSFESFFCFFALLEWFWWFILFFFKITKISFQHFFIMNNTQGNAQRQGAEPRRASTLNAISSPKPHFHCKHSNFWSAYRMRTIHMPKVNQKNRPFGLQFWQPLLEKISSLKV